MIDYIFIVIYEISHNELLTSDIGLQNRDQQTTKDYSI